MFFFLQHLSLLFSITRSRSFSVIHVSVNVKNNVQKDETKLLFFLSKSRGGHSISFQIKPWVVFRLPYLLIELFYIGIPVVRTDSRPVNGHVITNFSRMGSWPHILTHGAPLHTRELPAITSQLFENEPLPKLAAIWVKKAQAGFLRPIS